MYSTAYDPYPVTIDCQFWYDGQAMYVEQGPNRKRYTRADSKHLYDLLTNTDPTRKDETGAFYIAQMIHYGLRPVTTKAAAKKKLLEAFGDEKTLKVPKRLLGIEEDLKEEWEEECKRADVRRKEEREKQEKRWAKKADESRKRKASDEGGSRPKRVKTRKSRSDEQLRPSDLACRYTINAPSIAEEWPDDCSRKLSLTLCPSKRTSKHLWGHFHFGILKGVIRCSKTPSYVGETVDFEWRGHEQGEGEMYYDEGTMTFLGGGRICGTMECGFFSEECAFSGVQDQTTAARRPVSPKVLAKWKKEFRRINDISISMEGKWKHFEGGGDYEEDPAASDTSGVDA
ncbi:hypothetical protein PENSPDRAFT_653754 [Peniophora sp. CONT]|nr:hypothetical protein PENSPDRAFT_653754 [Peniophora sp. CONT]